MIDTIIVSGIVIIVGLWLTIAIIRAQRHGLTSAKSCTMDCVHCRESCRDVPKQNSLKDSKGIQPKNATSCCH